MLFNLVKILFLFFIIYFFFNLIRNMFILKSRMKKRRDEFETGKQKNNNGKVIELDKDQYKVE